MGIHAANGSIATASTCEAEKLSPTVETYTAIMNSGAPGDRDAVEKTFVA